MRLPRLKIDWPNHIIGFFSALFGILIAFELDQWRERNNELKLAKSAFENLMKEVDINQNILHENATLNLKSIHEIQRALLKVDRNLLFTGTRKEADSINKKFGKLLFIDLADSSSRIKHVWPVHIGMSNITVPSLQTSAWESAKATGALNSMPYEKVVSLSFVYNDSKIIDELIQIRTLLRKSDRITTKAELNLLLEEADRSHQVLENELVQFDQFVNMLEAME
jgi:hypothetical protein